MMRRMSGAAALTLMAFPVEAAEVAARQFDLHCTGTVKDRSRGEPSDQRALGLASTRIGARVPMARRRKRRLRTVRPFSSAHQAFNGIESF